MDKKTIDELLSRLPKNRLEQELKKRHRSECALHVENLNSIQSPVADKQLLEDLEFSYAQAADFCFSANEVAGDYGIRFSNATLESRRNSIPANQIPISQGFKRDAEDKLMGMLYPTTIKTTIDVINAFFTPDRVYDKGQVVPGHSWVSDPDYIRKICLVGVCQCGKTAVFSACFHILPVLSYVFSDGNITLVPYLNLPQLKDLERSATLEMLGFRKMYGDLIIQGTNISCSINQYWKILEDKGLFATADELIENTILIRTPKDVKQCRETQERLIEAGGYPLIFTDESQFGSNKEGAQDKIVRPHYLNEGFQFCSEISISATPDEQLAYNVIDNWIAVKVYLQKGFVGPLHCNGIRLPTIDDMQEVLPINQDVNVYLRQTGMGKVPLDLRAYKGFKNYCKIIHGKKEEDPSLELDWEAYKDYYAESLVKIGLKNFSWEGTQSIAIRSGTANKDAEELIERMKAFVRDRKVKFIKYYGKYARKGKKKTKRTVKELIRDCNKQGFFAIVVVTANARMGCAFPRCNNIFIDMTSKGSTDVAIMQGFYGRPCGFGKLVNGQPPLILCSAILNRQIDQLKANKFRFGSSTRPGRRTKKDAGHRERENILNPYIKGHYFDKETYKAVTDYVNLHWISSKRQYRSNPGSHLSCAFNKALKVLFNNEFLEVLPSLLPQRMQHIKLLKWEELDDDRPDCRFSVSTDPSQHKGGFGIRINRNYDDWGSGGTRNTRRFKDGIIEPQIVIAFKPDVICKECGSNVKDKLWEMHDSSKSRYSGHWNKERSTCCWNNAEIMLCGVNLRAHQVTGEVEYLIPVIATDDSRYLEELE